MATNTPNAVARPAVHRRRWRWVRGLVWLAQLCGFLACLVDELVTARLGLPAVLPRLARWRQQLVAEWRVHRAVVAGEVVEAEYIDGDVVDGVWR